LSRPALRLHRSLAVLMPLYLRLSDITTTLSEAAPRKAYPQPPFKAQRSIEAPGNTNESHARTRPRRRD